MNTVIIPYVVLIRFDDVVPARDIASPIPGLNTIQSDD